MTNQAAQQLLVDQLLQEKLSFIEMIKKMRQAFGFDITEAYAVALSHRGWRLLCARLIETDPQCRKVAINHYKRHGENGMIEFSNGVYRLRDK